MVQTVTMMCALAVRGAFEAQILPAFEARSGIKVETFWAPTTVIIAKLAAGERADVVVAMVDAMDRLAEQGAINPASRAEIAHSLLGVAVVAGAIQPEIGSEAAFIDSLLAARSVAYSRGGASGIYFQKLIDRLGIAEAINARATIIPQGFTAECLVSGAADLAVQQVSELMVVPGVEIIGPFPDAVQNVSSFSAAVTRDAADPVAASALIASFITAEAADAYRAHGVTPAFD
ncbi:MAG: substrate-binding domain-containing protein [Acetobacteraceae bacterium]|nr:substrate-binding domain-containing protein [Acetobacteraceae bacterium]